MRTIFSLPQIFLLFSLVFVTTNAQVGIGTTTPLSTFEVNGSYGQKVNTITTSATLDINFGLVVCDNGSTAITVTLPNVALCTGRVYTIKRNATSTANVTISGTIDGVTNFVMAKAGEAITLFSNGTEWKAASANNSSSSSGWNLTGNSSTNASDFVGTTDAQPLIIKTNNASRINVSSDGITKIGDLVGGNNTKFEADGTKVMEGNASVWDDLLVNPDATGKGSASPTFSTFKNGVSLWMFESGKSQEVFFTVQIPHKYKEGTSLFPHVHWTTSTGTPTGTNVVWSLEYTVVAIGGNFPATTILTSNSVVATPSGTGQHNITNLGTISGTGIGISTILVCRLFRAATDSRDTFSNSVGLLSMDFHYEIDTEGSRDPFLK